MKRIDRRERMGPVLAVWFVVGLMGVTLLSAQTVYEVSHTFTMGDVLGNFDGETYADNPSMICTSTACPGEDPFVDKRTEVTLYPIDSVFGFEVTDFVGGEQKDQDGIYEEGWVADVFGDEVDDNGTLLYLDGVLISNASTEKLKAGSPIGSWCAGLGGNSVKCSTEMFGVLEHVLTCYETIPYYYYDEFGEKQIEAPCEDGQVTIIPKALFPTTPNESNVSCEDFVIDGEFTLCYNDYEGERLHDLTYGPDYAVTIKDDGKPLYRWGSMVKRPTDFRMYARIPLPSEWKTPGEVFDVVRAELHLRHRISNNPNDQVRPEDWENEAATGRLPDFTVTIDGDGGERWRSKKLCYEGDGDLIEAGTVMRNIPFANPDGGSSDLRGGYTNAWYTTIERDPFEWAYRSAGGDLVGSPVPDASLGELVSGPRWRVKSNKFGQNIPGLEIPVAECTPPPYEHGTIRYEVGEFTTTVLNLLDWQAGEPSPLATSVGWVEPGIDPDTGLSRCDHYVGGVCISVNGQPLTEDFDLSIYVKGDKKPLAIYDAKLIVEYLPGGAL